MNIPLKRLALTVAIAGVTACSGLSSDQDQTYTEPAIEEIVVAGQASSKAKDEKRSHENDAVMADQVALTGSRVQRADLANASPASLPAMSQALGRQLTPPYVDRETYAHVDANGIKLTIDEPVSTFSIDVDTGAYANVRRFLVNGDLPPQDAVRVEEMINYFSYDYPVPTNLDVPFSVTTELAAAPWNEDAVLMQIGIKGYEVDASERPPANLVFLIDVSGSMHAANKLPLLKDAFEMLTGTLTARDRVAMVVYAGASGVVLEPTPGNYRGEILAAIGQLKAGGSTNGAAGIQLAYDVARSAFIDGGINRIILATDGDFNVGTVNFESLVDLVERQRVDGVSLTTLGFGNGNYNDQLMEQLANAGNGNHAYIDSANEARKVLVDQVGSTLQTIAKDVKIQIEFNPNVVSEYRLIGYENRMLEREDFNNDKVDAGEIGAGHTVTAIYELHLSDSGLTSVDPLRYQRRIAPVTMAAELGFVKLRYKAPQGDTSRLLEFPVLREDIKALADGSQDFRFAAAVAAFGQKLRGGVHIADLGFNDIRALARNATGRDANGYRSEFLQLIDTAVELTDRQTAMITTPGDEPSSR